MMLKSRLKTKQTEIYVNGLGGLSSAQIKVYLETQLADKYIYQNFRLVVSDSRLLQYFTDDRFLGYYILEKEMGKYYIGDGENIVYRKKTYYNNLITVTFERVAEIVSVGNESLEAQFSVEAAIPATLSCKDCAYFKKRYNQCLYHQEMGITMKKNCSDFRQKEV